MSGWARCWSRWSGPADGAARPRVGDVGMDRSHGPLPFPLKSMGTERLNHRLKRARKNHARGGLRANSRSRDDGAGPGLAGVRAYPFQGAYS